MAKAGHHRPATADRAAAGRGDGQRRRRPGGAGRIRAAGGGRAAAARGGGRGGSRWSAIRCRCSRADAALAVHRGGRKNAKLPLPPRAGFAGAGAARPGLLADVEIQVEKIPDVLHVPAQAVFKKGGKYTVFVHGKNGKFEPRRSATGQAQRIHDGARRRRAGRAKSSRWRIPTAEKSKKNGEKKSSAGAAMGGMRGGQIDMGLSQYRSRIIDGAGQPLRA